MRADKKWRSKLAAVAVALLAAALWVSSWFSPPEEKPALLEVKRAELVLRDDGLYQIGASEPFNGIMVEFYPDEALQSRSTISNGLLHGVSEGWHTNGVLQVKEHFNKGMSDGLRTKWHDNGKKLSEATIVQGKIHGEFRRWHENGELAEVIAMREGEAEGLAMAYYDTGHVKARVRLENGQTVEKRFWGEGEMREERAGR